MKNQLYICSNDFSYFYGYFPSCKEKYTGEFFCDLCRTYKNSNEYTCHGICKSYFRDWGIKINCTMDRSYVYICEKCLGCSLNYNRHGFYEIYCRDDYDYEIDKIKSAVSKKRFEDMEFICNECENKISDQKPYIYNNKNLCDYCHNKFSQSEF